MTPVSVVIPAFNEQDAITQVIQRLQGLPLDLEIIVVDDGSDDKTGARAHAAGAKVIRHPINGGYGLSLKTGIRSAKHALIAITDADGTYPVEDIPALLTKMEEGFDMVVGARQGPHYRGTFLKMPARFVFKFLVEFSTGRHIPDINSGLRIFRKGDVVELFPFLCNTFSFTTTLTLAYCFLSKFICYIPIRYDKRIGRSKVRFVRDSLRTLQFIVQSIAHFNPLKLFLLLALALFVLCIGSGVAGWWFADYFFVVATLALFLASIFMFALGILSEILRMRE